MTEGVNGRVTLALLGQKIDDLSRRIERLESKVDKQGDCFSAFERGATQREERIAALRDDVDRLQNRDAWGTITTGIIGAIAGLIGWFK